ncbi:MAG TPA: acetyl-CoA acetyltransferase [Acidimicrobiales bacterium]|nr:acetyl-CoA acetyltransferase [Acidimicrobiales bacterium]
MSLSDVARGSVAIVGATDLASPTGKLERPVRQLEIEMIRTALDDAGLSISDVDAIFSCTGMMASMELAEYLRIQPRYTDTTMTGGSSFEVHVEHATAALALGLCDVAVIVYAQTPRSSKGGMGGMAGAMAMMGGGDAPMLEWDLPYGFGTPASSYSLAATRHMAQFGTTSEQLAEIAVSTRKWAAFNPNARYQDPITVDDVLASPMIAAPLHKLDCCLVTDGAGAIVLTRADRAKDLKKPPVYVLGTGTSHTHAMSISQMPDLTVTAGAVSGPKAFAMAGLSPSDVDVVETYDSFTITVMLALEDLGFCKKGEGGDFVSGGRLAPGGELPTNTNGGGLSYTHPGMYGMFVLVEATRQLRGEGGEGRQVPDAKVAVAHGCGGVLSSTSTVVLGTEETV